MAKMPPKICINPLPIPPGCCPCPALLAIKIQPLTKAIKPIVCIIIVSGPPTVLFGPNNVFSVVSLLLTGTYSKILVVPNVVAKKDFNADGINKKTPPGRRCFFVIL